MFDHAGNVNPIANAKLTFTIPATKPLLPAINNESDEDIFRVKLLSIAQHKHAVAIAIGPTQFVDIVCFDHDNITPLATIRNIPNTIRLSVCSLNNIQAKTAVNTDSRFKRREAVAALVWTRPIIKKMGARTPPKIIAPNNHRHSFFKRPEYQFLSLINLTNPKPMPLPKYNNPASKMGDIVPTSCLAKGVLAPKRKAASNAAEVANDE